MAGPNTPTGAGHIPTPAEHALTDHTPDIDLDTRWAIAKIGGLNQLEVLIDNWDNATPEQIHEIAHVISTGSRHLIETLTHLDHTAAAIQAAIPNHPNPDIRALLTQGTP